jgi:acyl dehydratase
MRIAYIKGVTMYTEYDVGEIIEEDGALYTPFYEVVNVHANQAGGVQSDETAKRVGFQGGVVRGTAHVQQLPRVLLAGFGQRWFEVGGFAAMFIKPTMHGDRVRIGLQAPEEGGADEQVQIWVEREDGLHLVNGTAQLGDPKGASLARQMVLNTHGADDCRILADREVGMVTDRVEVRLDSVKLAGEPSMPMAPAEWYKTVSPWGGPIASPAFVPNAAGMSSGGLGLRTEGVVSMLGSQEVKYEEGPVFLDHDYVSESELVAIGSSPKSEYSWHESRLLEPDGTLIAKTLTQMRHLKKSSPLWVDEFPPED